MDESQGATGRKNDWQEGQKDSASGPEQHSWQGSGCKPTGFWPGGELRKAELLQRKTEQLPA